MGQLTPFAGLFELNPGEAVAEDGYRFYGNERIIDAYLSAFIGHRHDGHAAVQPFASDPTLVAAATGGTMEAGKTWYVGITAVDVYGGETNAQVDSVELPAAVADPTTAPTLTPLNDGSGTLTAGTYRYLFTKIDASGETLPSPVSNVVVNTNGRVSMAVVNGGKSWRVYRSFGYGGFSRVGSASLGAGVSTFVDDGSWPVYPEQPPPDENTTANTCKITVTRPTLPASATGWRVYFSQDEDLPDPALWSTDGTVEGATLPTASSSVIILDDGDAVGGTPPETSRTVAGATPVLASDVMYGGNLPYLPSGSVESVLDTLAESGLSVTQFRLAASGSSFLPGDVTLIAGSGISLSQDTAASSITINASGAQASGSAVNYLNGSAGVMTIVGSGGVSVSGTGGSIVVSATPGGVTSIAASGSAAVTGDIVFTSDGEVYWTSSGNVLTLHYPEGDQSIAVYGQTPMEGAITLHQGTGITLTQDDGASSITIEMSGAGSASAGVNSLVVPGYDAMQGNIGLYGAGGITLTPDGSALVISQGDVDAVSSLNASAGAITIVGSGGTTVTSAASSITIYSPDLSSLSSGVVLSIAAAASAASANTGNLLLAAGNGVTLTQSPQAGGSATTMTIAASRFRHVSGTYYAGDFTFQAFGGGTGQNGIDVDITPQSGYYDISIVGCRVKAGGATASFDSAPRDLWFPASASGVTMSEASLSGNDYRVDIRATRLAASAASPTYLGHRDIFLDSSPSIVPSESGVASAMRITFQERAESRMLGTNTTLDPSPGNDAGKTIYASGCTLTLASAGVIDGTGLTIKKFIAGGGTAVVVAAPTGINLEGVDAGSVTLADGTKDSVTLRYSTTTGITGFWVV